MKKNMKNKQRILKALKDARALIAKRGGWTQHESDNGKGAYCATRAIYRVLDGADFRYTVYGVLSDQITKGTTYYSMDATAKIIDFNDHPATTKKKVLALFDKAIKAESK